MSATIGYARVSCADQSAEAQIVRLKATGCTVVRTEKISGRSRDGRSELATILEFIQPGDTLMVVKLDPLGRSTRDVLNLVHELKGRGAHLRVLEPDISTAGPIGKMVLTVLGMVAEMELALFASGSGSGSRLPRRKVSTRVALLHWTTRASSPCAQKAKGPPRSPRHWDAAGGRSTRP